jgi:N-acyl-D-aspartate/D-glutamate deacylase
MTSLPAKRMGLKDRGLLQEGMKADIAVFDAGKVKDLATFEKPTQYAKGVPYVLVNGEITVDKGKRTAALAGQVIRGPGYKAPASR